MNKRQIMYCLVNIFGPVLLGVTLGCLINWCWKAIIPYLIQILTVALIAILIVKRRLAK